jgi:ribose/xylose/arabinose/galactoside ABC-type transport system permease subunit
MKDGKRPLKVGLTKYMLLLVAVVIFAFFAIASPVFASVNNIMNIVNSTAITAMLGIGMTIVMQTGQMDLSVGAEATIAAAVVGKVLEGPSFNNYFLAVLIGLGAALAVGILNAFFVVKIGIPSFIGTIAMSTFINGFIKITTGNRYMFSQYWPKSFTFLGQTRVFNVIPVPVIVLVIVGILTIVMQDRTKIGRYINSVGMSPAACRNVGINVDRIVVVAYLMCAVIAGFGGIVLSSEVKTVSPTLGSDLLMTVFAAVMMGATFYRPGRYNLQGTIVSALLLSIISNGTITLGASDFVDDLVQGIVIVVAVGFISMTQKGGLPSVKFNK